MAKHNYISTQDYAETDPSMETTADYIVTCAHPVLLPTPPYKVGPIGQLIAAPIPIQVLFVYPPPAAADGAAPAAMTTTQLSQALARALDDYPHLTGRLACDPKGVLTMEQFGSGALLREARCSDTLASLAGSSRTAAASAAVLSLMDLPGGGNALLPPLPLTVEAVAAAPPLVVQRTTFACGGFAIAVRILHVLCDGYGFFQFAQDLITRCNVECGAAVEARLPPPQLTAYLSNYAALASAESLAEARAYTPPLLHLAPPPPEGPPPFPPPPPEVQGRELRFTAAQLAAIKLQCSGGGGDGWVSTFEALGAFLATHIYQVRQARLPTPGANYYLSPVDIRPRMLPSAAEAARYFPVGSISACGPLPPEALAAGALPEVAAAVHAMIRSEHVEPAALQQQLRWVAAQPEPSRVRSNFELGGFMLSAWNKFEMYEGMKLGGAAPVFVGTPFTRISLLDGLAYVLPPPRPLPGAAVAADECLGADGLMIVVALNALLWEALSSDDHLGPYMQK